MQFFETCDIEISAVRFIEGLFCRLYETSVQNSKRLLHLPIMREVLNEAKNLINAVEGETKGLEISSLFDARLRTIGCHRRHRQKQRKKIACKIAQSNETGFPSKYLLHASKFQTGTCMEIFECLLSHSEIWLLWLQQEIWISQASTQLHSLYIFRSIV